MRQVTHALLTRPPLSDLPKNITPFDLHVLSTPPAFILSQDQTLMFDFWSRLTASCYLFPFFLLWFLFFEFFSSVESDFEKLCFSPSRQFLPYAFRRLTASAVPSVLMQASDSVPSSAPHRFACVRNLQRGNFRDCFVVQLSMFSAALSKQLIYNTRCFIICQQVFSYFLKTVFKSFSASVLFSVFRADSLLMIPPRTPIVNTFFNIFIIISASNYSFLL